jgi:hypothetical protein
MPTCSPTSRQPRSSQFEFLDWLKESARGCSNWPLAERRDVKLSPRGTTRRAIPSPERRSEATPKATAGLTAGKQIPAPPSDTHCVFGATRRSYAATEARAV